MQHQSSYPTTTPSSTSCGGGGNYTIRLRGVSIFVAVLSSASIALFSGRIASFWFFPNQRQRESQHVHKYQPSRAKLAETGGNMFNIEALVHPAMITHLNPKRVAVLGGEEHQTSATLREVLKHVSVKDAVIIGSEVAEWYEDDVDERISTLALEMNEQECSSEDHGLFFDVIIDPKPFIVATDFSSHFNCLNDGGVLVLNTDTLITHNDPALGIGRLKVLGRVIHSLEEVGYESVHLYQDENSSGGFETHSFLVALKSYESRAEWYSNEAEVNIRLHQRIGRSESLKFFDSPTMMKYQIPPKSVETVFCHGDDKEDECNNRAFDPELVNIPSTQLSVGQSTMGEHSGRGIFAEKDIPKGSAIGIEKLSLSYFIYPSSHRITMELYEWADEDEEDYVQEVFESVNAIVAFSIGYGFWLSLLGRTHSTVDSGLQMFCNHGCNSTYNYSAKGVDGNEADIDLNQPPDWIDQRWWGSPFSPALERNLRQMMTSGDVTNRDIKKGEEILCNYLGFIGVAAHWEEEIRGLQGQCDGTELGEISSYEREKRM